ncbi:DUF1775 domain-containing protein [Neisseria musculi]|uniref:Uncharacterized protein n=1 Tax=Neisseria musculi TaxID=1815583 RepID=A0ACD0ZP69_9NEIS|nr:DUF1775 domain-containing protein [Neisseria musculi]
MKLNNILSIAFLGMAVSTMAQAHVTVRNFANGVDSMSGKSDHFRLNVPTNRNKAVTQVKFVIPEEVKLLFIHPVLGWKYKVEKNSEGNISTVVYKGRMEAGEYTAFPFIARNPAKSDTAVKYKAYVTYEDKVVVPFDGSPEAKGYQPTILLK